MRPINLTAKRADLGTYGKRSDPKRTSKARAQTVARKSVRAVKYATLTSTTEEV